MEVHLIWEGQAVDSNKAHTSNYLRHSATLQDESG